MEYVMLSEIHAARPILGLFYIGRQRCNLCGYWVRFRSFSRNLRDPLAEHGFSYSLDEFETLNHRRYICPVCRSIDRDRLYKLYLDRFLRNDKICRFLEFAPSPSLSKYLRRRADLQYRTADLLMPGVDDVVDITDMQVYADDSFDFFICSHVLEHVPDDARALAELYRILAPGGSGIIMTPITPEGSFDEDPSVSDEAERWRRFAQGDHVRLYDRSTLCARIEQSQFSYSILDSNSFPDGAFARHAIAPGSMLYIVHKPKVDGTYF